MKKVLVVGGGAAGMMAAFFAAENGNEVVLAEKNEKLGKKIYITGKGRCNLTNDMPVAEFFGNVVNNPKFLYGSIYSFSPENVCAFFEKRGLTLKTERGNRVFPASDKASDVTKTLEKALRSAGVRIILETEIVAVSVNDGAVNGAVTRKNEFLEADSVIICTGGASYPLTGSTGDGYEFAKACGHSIVSPKPALVGIELKGRDFLPLQGLSLKNVRLTVFDGNKKIFGDFGEMLFTHYGISGPIVLTCSSYVNRLNLEKLTASVDLKPVLTDEVLDNRLLREFAENRTKTISAVVRSLVPSTLVELIVKRSRTPSAKICAEITKEERKRIIFTLKNLTFRIKALRPLEEAIVTSGGVSVSEVNPKTMESKKVKGLFFAGEVLDVDCLTGGFNLQTAFSTGYVAGKNA